MIDYTYSNSRLSEIDEGKIKIKNASDKNISCTLTCSPFNFGIRIPDDMFRVPTPLECWRLMGFSDDDYERASLVCDEKQLYQQAGNSIVVNVLMAIFKELFVIPKNRSEWLDDLSNNQNKGERKMFEKVNPAHPDKIADRIAGAIVDLAYKEEKDPKIAVEVLIGHGVCHIIAETSVSIPREEVKAATRRIAGDIFVDYREFLQNVHLARNQKNGFRCGDNGIFKGVPLTLEQKRLTAIAKTIYGNHPTDGKYIIDGEKLVICQSHLEDGELSITGFEQVIVNPLGYWTGGTDVDTGATNRKLGSDMADSVTGGGLHGKDLSKADVSVNVYAFLKAQETGEVVNLCCAIGDDTIDGKPYSEIVEIARGYINSVGGFEKFAEWGLVNA